jgi:hypothetical protein
VGMARLVVVVVVYGSVIVPVEASHGGLLSIRAGRRARVGILPW